MQTEAFTANPQTTWLNARIKQFKESEKAWLLTFMESNGEEKRFASVVLTHLSMHIRDLERVKREMP